MTSINSKLELRTAIIKAEEVRDEQKRALKDMIFKFKEELKPSHLIKKAFSELTDSPGLKSGVANSLIGLAAGFFSKKIIVHKSSGVIKNLLGDLLQTAITNYVTRHPDGIKNKGTLFLKNILSRVIHT